MQKPLGTTGKAVITILAALIVGAQLYFVSLPAETQKNVERIEDPANLLIAGLMVAFLVSLWILNYRRWQGVAVFIVLFVLASGVTIFFNVTG